MGRWVFCAVTAKDGLVRDLGSRTRVLLGVVAFACHLVAACAARQTARTGASTTSVPPSRTAANTRIDVERSLRERVLASEKRNDVPVRVEFEPSQLGAPVRALAMLSHGHGGSFEFVELDARKPRATQVRSLHCEVQGDPSLGDDPPNVTLAAAVLSGEEAQTALSRVATIMSARVEVGDPAAPDGQLALRSLIVSDDDQLIVIKLCDAERCIERNFIGYANNLDEAARAPVLLTWEQLRALRGTDAAAAPEDASHLLRDLWSTRDPLPDWARARMLRVAAAVPAPELVPLAISMLDAAPPLPILAVNVLAASSGRDLRRTPAGVLRPVEEIAAEYKRLAAQDPTWAASAPQ